METPQGKEWVLVDKATSSSQVSSPKKRLNKILLLGSIFFICTAIASFFMFSKPAKFKKPTSYTIEQLRILEKMGFKKSENLNLGDEYDELINADKVKLYHEKYGLRFLSQEGLNQLIKEFDYVIGSVADFKGVIPAENVDELAKKLKLLPHPQAIVEKYYVNGSVDENQPAFEYVSEENILPNAKIALSNPYHYPPVWAGLAVYHDFWNGNPKYAGIPIVLHKIYDKPVHLIENGSVKEEYDPYKELQVVGPKDYFDQTGKQIVDGHLTTIPKHHDPMIITRVDSGFVILTQW